MKNYLLIIALAAFCWSAVPRQKTWIAIGDSITYLNDHADETGNRVTKGYMTLITERYPHIKYINQGHNGWTSKGIADKIDNLGLEKADVYSVFLGTNDWWGGRPLGTIEDYKNKTGNETVYGSFRIITDKLKSLNKKAQIILITPMQRGDFVYIANYHNNAYGSYKPKNGQSLEQFANAIIEIGKVGKFKVVDLFHDPSLTMENMVHFKRVKDPETGVYNNYPYPAYTTIPFDPNSSEYAYPVESINMTYDGLHPSDLGYEVIAKRIVEKWKGLR